MIITCPHCQTKYQVTYEAIGSAGRKVQCAHCHEAWQQPPLDTFQTPPTEAERQAAAAIEEDGLDEVHEAEERAVAAEVAKRLAAAELEREAEDMQRRVAANNKTDAATQRKRQKDFKRRHKAMVSELPMARLRRTLRVVGTILLISALATLYFGRVEVVKRYPAMAGVYASIGLGVNVVGLDFERVTTLRALRDGHDLLSVSAQIVGLTPQPMPVPAVVVTLLDARGQGIYEWSVNPNVGDMMVGERATFETQLTMPPGDAASVRLSFAGGPDIVQATREPMSVEAHATPEGDHAAPETDHAAPAESHAAPAAAQAEEHAAPAASEDHSTTQEHH